MTNEEIQEIVAKADDEYDRLKDRVHEQYDEIEIIEEDKKIEKLLMIDGTANILLTANQTRRKINEIIDKLNKEE